MCRQSTSAQVSQNITSALATTAVNNSIQHLPKPPIVDMMRLDDYFFLDPIFIISMLVLLVIIVIIVSWWLERRKLAAAAAETSSDLNPNPTTTTNKTTTEDPELGKVIESRQFSIKSRGKSPAAEVAKVRALEGLLSTASVSVQTDNDANETEALLATTESEIDTTRSNGSTSTARPKLRKQTSFGSVRRIPLKKKDSVIGRPPLASVDGDDEDDDIENDNNGIELNENGDEKIVTIIPDVDFRKFPKTEEAMTKMRRATMLQMLSLPPLS